MKVLGIESSCDETAAAVVEDGRTILSNIVASQIDIHARYGGVVPEVASRQHILAIIPVVERALKEENLEWSDIDGIAVTYGPGLVGSLLVGVNTAKAIALARKIPVIGVNHMEAHIYANWLIFPSVLSTEAREIFPCLCLIVSGGHSDLVLMKGHGQFEKLGRTRDDAAGEAFDKAARILGLGYPGGPAIEKSASTGTPLYSLPRAWLSDSYDFSFSGLKTALWHLVHREQITPGNHKVNDVAASFQDAIVDVLVAKTTGAARKLGVRQILLSGGVSANIALRNKIIESSAIQVRVPPAQFCTDNAAMVAACGYFHFLNGEASSYGIDVVPGLSFADSDD
jgi:N6-L-threonylcarbamoyladenine synthase